MLMPFELVSPQTLDEAVSALAAYEGGCMVMAGGTDVLVAMHKGALRPRCVVDIKGIEELQVTPSFSREGLTLSSLATHDEVERIPEVGTIYTALKDGVSQIGAVQTRMRGTIGGNICNAAPSGDSIGALLVFDATLALYGPGGWRTAALADFFRGPKQTALLPGEILCSIRLPLPPVHGAAGSAYTKFSRRKAMDLALVGVAVSLGLDEDGICNHARIALATAAPTPLRAEAAEAYLCGRSLAEEESCEQALAEAARLALADAAPRSSWRADAGYRRRLIEALVPRTARKALERLAENAGRAAL